MNSKISTKLAKDFKVALKEKRILEVSVLRMLLASIKNKEIEKKKKEKGLSDEEIIGVISSEIKKRKEAAREYKKGNRPELAEKEEKEAEILSRYRPEQLSKQDIRVKAKETIEKLDAAGPQDLGKVMGTLMPELKEKAEGSRVSEIVQEELKKASR